METKPSPAALRAATEIAHRRRTDFLTSAAIAEIIDRETGLPELVAAYAGLEYELTTLPDDMGRLSMFNVDGAGNPTPAANAIRESMLVTLSAALAKATKGGDV